MRETEEVFNSHPYCCYKKKGRLSVFVSVRQKQHSEMSLTAILSEIDGGDDKGVGKLLQKYNLEVKRLLLAYHLMLFYCALALEILAS